MLMAMILCTLIVPGLLKLFTAMLIELVHLLCDGGVINDELVILIIEVDASIASDGYLGLMAHLVYCAKVIAMELLKVIVDSYSLYNVKLRVCVMRLWELGVVYKYMGVWVSFKMLLGDGNNRL